MLYLGLSKYIPPTPFKGGETLCKSEKFELNFNIWKPARKHSGGFG